MIPERTATIPVGPGLTLEAAIAVPVDAGAGVVLCHPHPLYGGDMHNPVVVRAARAGMVARLALVAPSSLLGREDVRHWRLLDVRARACRIGCSATTSPRLTRRCVPSLSTTSAWSSGPMEPMACTRCPASWCSWSGRSAAGRNTQVSSAGGRRSLIAHRRGSLLASGPLHGSQRGCSGVRGEAVGVGRASRSRTLVLDNLSRT